MIVNPACLKDLDCGLYLTGGDTRDIQRLSRLNQSLHDITRTLIVSRDFENVALDPGRPVNVVNEAYFEREVLPHVPESCIDANKRDARDGEIGIVGYEIPFNRHFYVYQPPRPLEVIRAEIEALEQEIQGMLGKVFE